MWLWFEAWDRQATGERWGSSACPGQKKKKKKISLPNLKHSIASIPRGPPPLLYGMMISLHNLRRLINSQYLPNFFFFFFLILELDFFQLLLAGWKWLNSRSNFNFVGILILFFFDFFIISSFWFKIDPFCLDLIRFRLIWYS